MIYIDIDRHREVSLTRQIYRSLKEDILSGTLQQGEKLPSSRELAKDLNVARNVVIESYDQLIAEGYAYSRSGSGTYVCEAVKLEKQAGTPVVKKEKDRKKQVPEMISFRTGIPDLNSIPIKKWAQAYREIISTVMPAQLDYQNPFGEYELRYQLSLYLNRVRGVCTTPENILITNGAAQSFSLLCRLVSEDEYALVENPLSYGILHTLESNKVKIRPIEIDEYGMLTAELPTVPPRLIFTTPSHQFPSGVTLPARRRIELVQYARKYHTYIVEDDYDSEFRFDGSPIQSMQQLDPQWVIYVGTFSKTFMPALRMGYMVLPDSLCMNMEEAKFVADLHSPTLDQLTMAKLIESGQFDLHIRKMRKLYCTRRNLLIRCLKEAFEDTVKISGAEAGMHLIAKFENIVFNEKRMQEIEDRGIQISAVTRHWLPTGSNDQYKHSLIFGYGNTDRKAIEAGVNRLEEILNEHRFPPSPYERETG